VLSRRMVCGRFAGQPFARGLRRVLDDDRSRLVLAARRRDRAQGADGHLSRPAQRDGHAVFCHRRRPDLPAADIQSDREPGGAHARDQASGRRTRACTGPRRVSRTAAGHGPAAACRLRGESQERRPRHRAGDRRGVRAQRRRRQIGHGPSRVRRVARSRAGRDRGGSIVAANVQHTVGAATVDTAGSPRPWQIH